MPQRNSEVRDAMLDERAIVQRTRTSGFTPMMRKPPNWPANVKYDPKQDKVDVPYHLLIKKERRLKAR